jgi:hypothetical protein
MSLAISESQDVTFHTRFEHVWASLRRYQVRQGLGWSFLAAALGLAALAAADYRLELPWNLRAAGLLAAVAVTMVVLWGRVIAPLRWWTKGRTAVEIEGRFPQLGQRIRTVVQYAGLPAELIDSEGVMPSLVSALEAETEIQANPLPLDGIVPWRRVWAVAALAAVPALLMLVAAGRDPEWRIALRRAMLSDRPYTTLAVVPGNLTIEQGESVRITVELSGRLKRDVVLYTRPEGQPDASWKAAALEVPDRGPASARHSEFEKVKEPLEYRVTAGPASSPTFRIGVRYPLAIQSFDVSLVPPAYTNVAPSTVKGGDLRVIEGTDATFRISFDSPPAEASLILTDPSVKPAKGKAPPAPRTLSLNSDGKAYTAGLKATKGLVLQIVARTADGRALPANRYKLDVIEDRAPRVSFEQPEEALEVHPLAEIVNRIRVGDDFGLTRAGIVFQFNNGDEQTLIVKDFNAEPAKSRTTAALQETLLLEKLAASPTDSLTYYGFAEDNYPAGAHRTETDMRYLDIRPFKREYKLADSAGDAPEGEGELASLAELIGRQRFNLNRANRLAKHKPTDRTFAEDPLKIATFEETLAKMTRELTEGVEGIVGQRIEPFHQAEESMLAAVGALDHGQNDRAPAHMGDALRHLIEARNTVRILIGQDPEAAKAMRGFDRMQAQKIRKPKKDQEEAEAIADEVEQLAQEEDFVYATLGGLLMEQQQPDGKAKGDGEAGKDEDDPEKKEEPAEKKGEPQKGDPGAKGEKGPKGQKGAKGKGAPGQGQGQPGENGETPEDDDKAGDSKNDRRREAVERQEKIADRARELEEKLKKLEDASDLAKLRMGKAAEATEKVAGALNRDNTKEAAETAKAGAAMLHELARQVKGELARDVAQELAMARDLADELARREAELGQMPGSGSEQGNNGDQPGKGEKGESGQKGQGTSGDSGRGESRLGGRGDLTDAERLERMEEAARTLEQWLKDASLRAEGEAAGRIRELIEERDATQVVERMERIGALYLGGQEPAARREATEFSKVLELLARQLEVLHRGIVAPELAAMVEFDRRVAELMTKLKTIKTDAEIAEWHRLADALVRDLEKAGLTQAATALTDAFEAGGRHWGVDSLHFRTAPAVFTVALTEVSRTFQEKIQNLILKDLASARDEATPPEFKELVERYYEVLSKEGGKK